MHCLPCDGRAASDWHRRFAIPWRISLRFSQGKTDPIDALIDEQIAMFVTLLESEPDH